MKLRDSVTSCLLQMVHPSNCFILHYAYWFLSISSVTSFFFPVGMCALAGNARLASMNVPCVGPPSHRKFDSTSLSTRWSHPEYLYSAWWSCIKFAALFENTCLGCSKKKFAIWDLWKEEISKTLQKAMGFFKNTFGQINFLLIVLLRFGTPSIRLKSSQIPTSLMR